MGASIFRFSLDVHKTQSQVSISASQYSTDKRLIIRLMERGIPYVIEDGCFAVFSAIKPDGKPLYNDCMIRNNTIIYDFTKQTTPVVGILPCQIHLYGADGRLLMAPRFQIIVYEAVYDGEAVESSAEYLAMSEYINHIFDSYEWKGEKVFIRYSANANGEDFTEFWTEGQRYIGVATGLEAPESPLAYRWALFIGEVTGVNVSPGTSVVVGSEEPSTACLWFNTSGYEVKTTKYTVKYILTNCESRLGGTALDVDVGSRLQDEIYAFDGYTLARGTITMGGVVVSTYDPSGAYYWQAGVDSITGDVVITAVATPIEAATLNLTEEFAETMAEVEGVDYGIENAAVEEEPTATTYNFDII